MRKKIQADLIILELKSIRIIYNQEYKYYELIQKLLMENCIREVGTLWLCLDKAHDFLLDDEQSPENKQLLEDMKENLYPT